MSRVRTKTIVTASALRAEIARTEAYLDILHRKLRRRSEVKQQQREHMAQAVAEGKTADDIAYELRLDLPRTQYLLRRYGLKPVRKTHAHSLKFRLRDAKAVSLAQGGATLDAIGAVLGLTRERVRQILAIQGVPNGAQIRKRNNQEQKERMREALATRPCPLCGKPCGVTRKIARPFCAKCKEIFSGPIKRNALGQVFAPAVRPILAAWLRGETMPGICCICDKPTRKGLSGTISFHADCGAVKAMNVRVHTAQVVIRKYSQFDWRKIILDGGYR